jgi:hypothetical protein
MQDVRTLYPELKAEPFHGPCEYGPLLGSLGEIAIQVDDNNYQGDSRVLYRGSDGRWGVLLFGWGSCSGCDALQCCDTYEDLEKLRQGLVESVQWGTAAETAAYLRGKDWRASYMSRDENARFVREALTAMGAGEEEAG